MENHAGMKLALKAGYYLYKREKCSHLGTFQELREDGLLFDVTIKVEEKTWKAHKVVLSTIPYFYSMFRTKMAESQKEEITLQGFDPETFELFYDFAYTGTIKINTKNVQEVIEGASFFNLKDIMGACRKYLKNHLNSENIWEIKAVADILNDKVLIQETYEYISKHFNLLYQAENFLLIDFETFHRLISDNTLYVRSEEQVFEAVMRWVKHDPNRHDKLLDLLKKVKLPLLSRKYLFNNVAKEKLVRKSSPCRDLLETVYSYHLHVSQDNPLDEYQLIPRCATDDTLIVFTRNFVDEMIKIERYDSAAGTWILSKAIGQKKNCGDLFMDKRLYCVKKFRNDSRKQMLEVDIYNSDKNSWETVMTEIWDNERQCIAIVNNYLYIWGHEKEDRTKRIGEKYSFVTKKWTKLRCYSQDICKQLCVIHNCIYFCTTDFCYILQYDIDADQWTKIPLRGNSRRNYGFGELGGKLYLCGGINASSGIVKTVDVYDPVLNKWSSTLPMLSTRSNPAVVGYMGKLWVIGGTGNTVEVFNPDAGTWSYAPSLTTLGGNNLIACVSRIP